MCKAVSVWLSRTQSPPSWGREQLQKLHIQLRPLCFFASVATLYTKMLTSLNGYTTPEAVLNVQVVYGVMLSVRAFQPLYARSVN